MASRGADRDRRCGAVAARSDALRTGAARRGVPRRPWRLQHLPRPLRLETLATESARVAGRKAGDVARLGDFHPRLLGRPGAAVVSNREPNEVRAWCCIAMPGVLLRRHRVAIAPPPLVARDRPVLVEGRARVAEHRYLRTQRQLRTRMGRHVDVAELHVRSPVAWY